ncbi:hypothetical protein [Pseudovibrio sp. POLY-S9]|uniref:hypothetical protein n=1 Tax=Pseudovibrio sp. POLY-S9 TaxID=1576596 RepID=UPI0007097A63|nr:hypothetical protein [Pseudovibrio sp. POLY-S9]
MNTDLKALLKVAKQLNAADWVYPPDATKVPRVELRDESGEVIDHLIIAKYEDSGALALAAAVTRAFANGELVPASAVTTPDETKKNFCDFETGFLLACLQVATEHGAPEISADVLRNAGISERAIEAIDLTDDDKIALANIRDARGEDPFVSEAVVEMH